LSRNTRHKFSVGCSLSELPGAERIEPLAAGYNPARDVAIAETILGIMEPWLLTKGRRFVAARSGRRHRLPEIVQAARLGVLQALQNFRPGRVRFTTYAYPYVKGAMYRVAREDETPANVSLTEFEEHRDQAGNIRQARSDSPIGEDWRPAVERKAILAEAFQYLTPRQQAVLQHRFGEDRTLPEVAVLTGCSRPTAVREIRGALATLREVLDTRFGVRYEDLTR
jgi:RNA polymerase sigma factor (sigma-70 family)